MGIQKCHVGLHVRSTGTGATYCRQIIFSSIALTEIPFRARQVSGARFALGYSTTIPMTTGVIRVCPTCGVLTILSFVVLSLVFSHAVLTSSRFHPCVLLLRPPHNVSQLDHYTYVYNCTYRCSVHSTTYSTRVSSY
jgi:hypothetical protein